MTIRERLKRSNLIMLVVPIAIAGVQTLFLILRRAGFYGIVWVTTNL